MAVRFFSPLAGALLLALAGCSGNLVDGLPRDGGDDLVEEPTGNASDGGTRSDARVTTPAPSGRDGGATGGGGSDEPGGGETGGGKDGSVPSAPPPAQSDASVSEPPVMSGSRDYSTDKAKFLGASRCSEQVLFCDDFEQTVGGQPGAAYTYPFEFKPTIDMTRGARGTRALLFNSTGGTPAHIQTQYNKVFPANKNTVYGRLFVWVEGLPSAPNYAHYTLVGMSGTGNGAEVRLDGQLQGTKNAWGIGSDGGDTGDWHTPGTDAKSTPVEKAWTCMEWMFKGDTSETRVWIDAVEQTSLHTTSTEYRPGDAEMGKTFTHPTFDKLRFGWWTYQSGTTPATTKVWIDELALDDERIGCVL